MPDLVSVRSEVNFVVRPAIKNAGFLGKQVFDKTVFCFVLEKLFVRTDDFAVLFKPLRDARAQLDDYVYAICGHE